MKHKGKNRVLAALLAAAMMFQMLPLMVFADDGAASSDVKIKGKEGTYTSLKEAVEKAESGDTILLGEGDYSLRAELSRSTPKRIRALRSILITAPWKIRAVTRQYISTNMCWNEMAVRKDITSILRATIMLRRRQTHIPAQSCLVLELPMRIPVTLRM